MLAKGDSLFLKNPGTGVGHLYFILTEPNKDNRVLLVNITTHRFGKDETCILNVGDHPFIRHKSVVEYSEAIEPKLTQIEKLLETGYSNTPASASDDLLERMQDGARKSPALPSKYTRYFDYF